MSNKNKTLAAVIQGMDERTIKNMKLFFQGPCQGAAHIVTNNDEADVYIFDADSSASKKLLEQHLQNGILKPVIVLSLSGVVEHSGVITVKKPVNTDVMLKGLDQANKLIRTNSKRAFKVKNSESNRFEKRAPDDWFDDWFESQI